MCRFLLSSAVIDRKLGQRGFVVCQERIGVFVLAWGSRLSDLIDNSLPASEAYGAMVFNDGFLVLYCL